MKYSPHGVRWLLPALLLAGCATDPPSSWQDRLSRLQEDIETRSLTQQLTRPQSEAVPIDFYGTGSGSALYMDIYGEYSYGPVPGSDPGPPYDPFDAYGPLYGGLYSTFGLGYFRGPPYNLGPSHRFNHPRVFPRPGAAPGSAPPRPGLRHPSHTSGSHRGRAKR